MGSFAGHILSGSLFLLVGTWHIWSCVLRYVTSPETFRVRVWYPVPVFYERLKYLELYFISIGVFIDLLVEFLYSTQLKIFVGGILNPTYLNNFHVFSLLCCCPALRKDKISSLARCCSFFNYRYSLLFYYHSTTHKGLEGYYHALLGFLIGLCVLSSIAEAIFSTSFPIDLCNGIAITLQGIWYYQTAFVLYGRMRPAGCQLIQLKDKNIVPCHSIESEIRGELFANVQLFVAVLVVHIGTIASFCFAASRYGNFEQISD